MELNPLAILGACERLGSWAGKVENVYVEYEKIIMYLTKRRGQILALTLERGPKPDDDYEAISAIDRSLTDLIG